MAAHTRETDMSRKVLKLATFRTVSGAARYARDIMAAHYGVSAHVVDHGFGYAVRCHIPRADSAGHVHLVPALAAKCKRADMASAPQFNW